MHSVSPIMLPICYQLAICSECLRPFMTLSRPSYWHTSLYFRGLVTVLLVPLRNGRFVHSLICQISLAPFPLLSLLHLLPTNPILPIDTVPTVFRNTRFVRPIGWNFMSNNVVKWGISHGQHLLRNIHGTWTFALYISGMDLCSG